MIDRVLGRFSLRFILIFPFAIILVLSGGLIGLLGFQNGTNAANDLANQLLAVSAARIDQHLNSYLSIPHFINDANLDAIRLKQLNLADTQALEYHFLAQMQHFETIAAITYANIQREYVGVTRNVLDTDLVITESSAQTNFALTSYQASPEGERGKLLSTYANYDPTIRPWFQAAAKASQTTWTPIFVWSRNAGIGLDNVTPIYSENGDLIGVLDVSITLSGISEFLADTSSRANANIFIVDEEGLLIGSSNSQQPYIVENNQQLDRLNPLDATDPLLRTATQSVVEKFGNWNLIQSPQELYFDYSNERQLSHIAPYQNHDLRWWIVVFVPESAYIASITNHNHDTFIAIISALIFALILMTVVSRWITRPILRLNSAAKAFSSGKWSEQLFTERKDELGELIVSFNQMVATLQASTRMLQDSEARLRAFFENSADAINVSRDGIHVMANPAFLTMFGYSSLNDVVGKSVLDVIADSERARIADYIGKRSQQDLPPSAYETRGRRLDGSEVEIEVRISTYRYDGIDFTLAILRDITERKAAELKLRESRAMLDATFNNMKYAINVGHNGIQVMTNAAAAKLFGYDNPDEFVGVPIIDFIAPSERSRIAEYTKLRSNGLSVPDHYLTRGLKKDGTEFDIEVTISTYSLEREVYTLAVIRDITEEKRLEQSEREQSEFNEALVYSAKTIQQTPELEVVLEKILDLVQQVVPYDAAGIIEIKNGVMMGRSMRGFVPRMIELMQEGYFRLEKGTAATQVVTNGQPVAMVFPRSDGMTFNHIPGFEAPHSRLGAPISVQNKVIGFLLLIKREVDFYEPRHINRSMALTTQIANAYLNADLFDRQHKLLQQLIQSADLLTDQKFLLAERIKELTCLYEHAKLLEQREIASEALFQGTVDLIPAAWKFPEITCARLIVEGQTYMTPDFGQSPWQQSSLIKVNDKQVGTLEVVYREERPQQFEGPFYREERLLLDELARRLGQKIETLQADEALRQAHATLERKVIERTAQLNTAKERVEAILNNSVDGILFARTDFTIRQTNTAFYRLFACEAHTYLDRSLLELFQGEPDDAQISAIRDCVRDRRDAYIEVRALRHDGSTFDAELGLGHIQGEGMVCVIRDITVHKQAEDALRQALAREKELGELKIRFLSMASHEFRTPLATILAASDALNTYRHRMTEVQIADRFKKIKEQVRHLTDIMEDVLQLARMQARRLEYHPVLQDLDVLCRNVLDEFQSRPDIKHRLQYKCSGEAVETMLDPKLMRQLISNLVSNAIKYSANAEHVNITLEYANSTATLKVRDKGIGIPETDLPHLFEPFHRAGNVGAISGTGLGLVITKEAVDLHGGTIAVESQMGVGTTFIVNIPMAPKTS